MTVTESGSCTVNGIMMPVSNVTFHAPPFLSQMEKNHPRTTAGFPIDAGRISHGPVEYPNVPSDDASTTAGRQSRKLFGSGTLP